MKRFIYASVAYLAIGSFLAMFNSVASLAYVAKYAHTHFNLAGFMAMMVFGIGYFILPRFNGADIRFPSWIPVHFWLGNVSLVLMVATKGIAMQTQNRPTEIAFEFFATIQLISILMFVVNIWATLQQKPAPALQPNPIEQPQAKAEVIVVAPPTRTPLPQATSVPAVTVSQHSRVAELVDLVPSVKQILVSKGLSSLAMPGHVDKVRAMGVTLGMACRNHGLDLEGMIEAVSQELTNAGVRIAGASAPQINGDAMIGEVLQDYPEARDVFQRYFGSGCFDCPGQAFESVSMACKMHGVDEQQFLNELASAVR
jgi:hybrid cluster-associated redox disulfide protein